MNTLVNIREVALAGGTQAVAWGLQGVVSGRQLRQQVLAQARALAQLEAHTVALWLPQSDDFLITFLALALTGKHIVLPHTLQVGVGRQMAAHFDALITHTRQPAFNCAQYTPAELIEHGAAAPEGVYNCAQPVAITLFTSGSTGVPQTVHKTLAELEAEVAVLAHDFPHMGSAPVLTSVSHHHIYGLLHVLLWPLYRGAAFVVELAQYPETLLEQLQQYGPAVWVASPSHLARMPQSPLFVQAAQHLSEVMSSGGLLSEVCAAQLAQLLGRSPLEVLGSTETGGVAWRRQSDSTRWRALHGVVVAQSGDGCLSVRSAHLDLPEAFVMGDKIEALQGNSFALLGRADSVVKVEGKRLSLTELEARLSESPWIAQCRAAVIRGRRDEVGVVACLTPRGEQQLSQTGKHNFNTQLRHYLADYFDRPVLPRRWRYLEQLPSNTQGKVLMADIIRILEERGG